MTKVIISSDAIDSIPRFLKRFHCKHCVVVISGAMRNSEKLMRGLHETQCAYSFFTPKGSLPLLSEALRCHREVDVPFDTVIAVGGGKIIDIAKAVTLDEDVLISFQNRSRLLVSSTKTRSLIAIPTLAGSGSEVTPFAVTYIDGIKHSLSHPQLAPIAALIEPNVMASASSYQRIVSGIDALAHGIESLLSKRTCSASEINAKQAIKIAHRIFFDSWPSEAENFHDLFTSAVCGGSAISITKTSIPHALSYYFTSVHGLPHGHAIALSMGNFLKEFGNALSKQPHMAPWKENYRFILDVFRVSDPDSLARIWIEGLQNLGLATSLQALNISVLDADKFYDHVNFDRFDNSALDVSKEQALKFIIY